MSLKIDLNFKSVLSPWAVDLLSELRDRPGADLVVIGGGVALQHYLPIRPTNDLDAWWIAGKDNSLGRKAVVEATSAFATKHGLESSNDLRKDIESFDFGRGGKILFSFEIAYRDIQLEDPIPSPWAPIMLESFGDNIGSKMSALVRRGAPRDFLDIYNVCERKLISPDECWALWQAKNVGQDQAKAYINVAANLESLERRRPLSSIQPLQDRTRAQHTRNWYRSVFLRGRKKELGLGR